MRKQWTYSCAVLALGLGAWQAVALAQQPMTQPSSGYGSDYSHGGATPENPVDREFRRAQEQVQVAQEQMQRAQEEFARLTRENRRPGQDVRIERRIQIPMMEGGPGMPMHGPGHPPMSPEDRKDLEDFRALLNRYRQSPDGEKDELRDQIRENLARQFERDLERRTKQLEEIEQRASALRDQLESNRENRETVIESLMRVVENPNNGFGLPREWMDAIIGGSQPGMHPGPGEEGFFQQGPQGMIFDQHFDNFMPSPPPQPGQPPQPESPDTRK